MEHCMTVGTDWHQIIDWIDLILSADRGDGHQVMHMNITTPDFTVPFLEVQMTHLTDWSVVVDACSTRRFATLVGVHENCSGKSFWIRHISG